jgi:hypothetical protein
LPYIELDGVLIPDSENAYNTLVSRGATQNLDEIAGLTFMERAQSLALRIFNKGKPTLVDANVFGFLVCLLVDPT